MLKYIILLNQCVQELLVATSQKGIIPLFFYNMFTQYVTSSKEPEIMSSSLESNCSYNFVGLNLISAKPLKKIVKSLIFSKAKYLQLAPLLDLPPYVCQGLNSISSFAIFKLNC